MPKWTLKQFLFDKLFLLTTAIIAGIILLSFVFFLKGYLYLAREWTFFILESIGYTIIVLYLAIKSPSFKKCSRKTIPLLIILIITGSTILVFFLIFYLDILPLPTYLLPYIIGATFLGTASLQFFKYFIKVWQKRKEL